MTLKEQLSILDEKQLVKIQLKNLELYTNQVKNIDFTKIKKIENQEVKSLIPTIINFVDNDEILIVLTLNYELNFGE